jgi:hypothetical protein
MSFTICLLLSPPELKLNVNFLVPGNFTFTARA